MSMDTEPIDSLATGIYRMPTEPVEIICAGYSDFAMGRWQEGTYEKDPVTGDVIRKPKQLPTGTRYIRDDEGWLKIHTTPDMWSTREFIEDQYSIGMIRYPGRSFRKFRNGQIRTWTVSQILGAYA